MLQIKAIIVSFVKFDKRRAACRNLTDPNRRVLTLAWCRQCFCHLVVVRFFVLIKMNKFRFFLHRNLETVAADLDLAEMKKLRFSLGEMRMDGIWSESFRGIEQGKCYGDECRWRWFGHVQWWCWSKVLRVERAGTRLRGRANRKFMDVVKNDMYDGRMWMQRMNGGRWKQVKN